jgi:hypothetical protein
LFKNDCSNLETVVKPNKAEKTLTKCSKSH